jgi:hypothetical protein
MSKVQLVEEEGEYNMMTVIHLNLNTDEIPLQVCCERLKEKSL